MGFFFFFLLRIQYTAFELLDDSRTGLCIFLKESFQDFSGTSVCVSAGRTLDLLKMKCYGTLVLILVSRSSVAVVI